MTKAYYICFFIIFTISPIIAQKEIQLPGKCPPAVNAKLNLNKTQFAGRWYEVYRFPNKLITGECGIAQYNKKSNGFTVRFVSINLLNKKNSTLDLEFTKSSTNTSAIYNVHINKMKEDIPQYVLETDYKTYSVVWGCYSANNKTHTQRLSIFSRNKEMDTSTYKKAVSVLDRNGISYQFYLTSVQQNDTLCERKGGGSGGSGGGSGGSGGGSGGGGGGSGGGGGGSGGGVGGSGGGGGGSGGGGGGSGGNGGENLKASNVIICTATILFIKSFIN